MPESAILRPRVSIEPLSNSIGSQFVFRILCFLIQQEQKIAGHHAIETVVLNLTRYSLRIRVCHYSVGVHVRINPILDVLKVFGFVSSFVNEILTIQIERFGVTPGTKIFCGRVTLHS
jgi:hypothetical protein